MPFLPLDDNPGLALPTDFNQSFTPWILFSDVHNLNQIMQCRPDMREGISKSREHEVTSRSKFDFLCNMKRSSSGEQICVLACLLTLALKEFMLWMTHQPLTFLLSATAPKTTPGLKTMERLFDYSFSKQAQKQQTPGLSGIPIQDSGVVKDNFLAGCFPLLKIKL